MNRHTVIVLGLVLSFSFTACDKKEEPKPQPAKTLQAETRPAPAKPEAKPEAAPKPAVAPELVDMGDFGSDEAVERKDLPTRGVITFPVDQKTLSNGMHWDQYTFPFKTKRWGKYRVRLTYTLKNSSLGVQFKYGENALKKQLATTNNAKKQTTLGEIYIANAGDQFMALYTPQGVGFNSFELHSIELIPTHENETVKQTDGGALELQAKHATTWSENMRYEPKPEKDCLGFWTDANDFAEWEFKVEKPGKYKVAVLQGSSTGGSEIAVQLGDQQLKFTVQNTGDFHKHEEVKVGEVEIKAPGTYRLALKPQTKNGGAIMDVKKVVLAPVS